MNVRINEIFYSIDGEGKRAGFPAIFIRLSGCNLRCDYCDTKYAFSEGENKSIESILWEIRSFGCNNVTITGGEPLIQPHTMDLIKRLKKDEYNIIIETNGSVDISEAMKYASICLDWKTESSGENEKMLLSNIEKLRETDVLKIVMRDTDAGSVERFIDSIKTKAPIYLSPVFHEANLSQMAEIAKRHPEKNVRIQLQIHKFIWNPDERGV